MITLSDTQGLLGQWWYQYDQGELDSLPSLLTEDVHFTCESDTGTTAFEDFIRADQRGRDDVMAWQIDHRLNSPFPLRHSGTNIHLTRSGTDDADFASYIVVTHIVDGAVSPLSTGLVRGTVRREGGALRIARLRVILDTQSSVPLVEYRAAATAG